MTPAAASTPPRKRWWKRLIVALTAAALILVVWVAWPRSELSYKGKPYRKCVLDYSESFLNEANRSPDVNDQMASGGLEAIRNVGTNGIPTLIEMLGVKDSRAKALMVSWKENRTPVLSWITPRTYPAYAVRSAGYQAFAVLGGEATSAIPALRILATSSDLETRKWVEGAMRRIEEGLSTNK